MATARKPVWVLIPPESLRQLTELRKTETVTAQPSGDRPSRDDVIRSDPLKDNITTTNSEDTSKDNATGDISRTSLSHCDIEKKRKHRITSSIQQLATILELENRAGKITRADILQMAVDRITELKEENLKYTAKISARQDSAKEAELNARLKELLVEYIILKQKVLDSNSRRTPPIHDSLRVSGDCIEESCDGQQMPVDLEEGGHCSVSSNCFGLDSSCVVNSPASSHDSTLSTSLSNSSLNNPPPQPWPISSFHLGIESMDHVITSTGGSGKGHHSNVISQGQSPNVQNCDSEGVAVVGQQTMILFDSSKPHHSGQTCFQDGLPPVTTTSTMTVISQVTTLPQPTVPQVTTLPQPTVSHVTTLPRPTVPQVTTLPQPTVPQVTTTPQPTVPEIATLPQVIMPQVTTIPQVITLSQVTTTSHVTTVPQATVSNVNMPQATVSHVNMSQATVSHVNMPQATVSHVNNFPSTNSTSSIVQPWVGVAQQQQVMTQFSNRQWNSSNSSRHQVPCQLQTAQSRTHPPSSLPLPSHPLPSSSLRPSSLHPLSSHLPPSLPHHQLENTHSVHCNGYSGPHWPYPVGRSGDIHLGYHQHHVTALSTRNCSSYDEQLISYMQHDHVMPCDSIPAHHYPILPPGQVPAPHGNVWRPYSESNSSTGYCVPSEHHTLQLEPTPPTTSRMASFFVDRLLDGDVN